MNEFVHGLRQMLDEIGREKGRRLALSVTVTAGLEQCAYLGLDVAHWLHQQWLDRIIIHPCWLPNRWLDTDVAASQSVTGDRVAEVKALAEAAGCGVYADVYPRYMPPAEYPARALQYYQSGADGLCFWDTYCRISRAAEWSAIRQLGHVDELVDLRERAGSFRTVTPMLRAAGMSLAPPYTPATNGWEAYQSEVGLSAQAGDLRGVQVATWALLVRFAE